MGKGLRNERKNRPQVLAQLLPAMPQGCKLAEMEVKILGSAAGGAFPQWNCACANCRRVRAGTFSGKPRSQTQVAVSQDGRSWFLLGASPDLRTQIEATPELHPHEGLRQSPIAGVALANADLDHVLGLLLLRELQPLRVHATASVRRILREDNSMFAMLQRVTNQIVWTDFATGKEFYLCNAEDEESGLRCCAWSLSTHYPAYVAAERRERLAAGEASLGFILDSDNEESRSKDSHSSLRLAYMPAVPQIDDALLEQLDRCDVLLFDGTFWSDDELIRVQGSGQTALQMGHVPVESTLVKLAGVRCPRKIFLHINNTNPMLDEASPQHRQVRSAGWEIAEDGWQFNL
ncbi:MAG: pyrroloquinoline quinone biosynthesis protein PqqB [Candidatus Sulfotelmatobacter sp.]